MKKGPQGRYSKELREEAVEMVIRGGSSVGETAHRLNIPKSTISNWVKAFRKGTLGNIGRNARPLSDLEMELARVKRELAETKMERDILKKAAAYFAKESLQGTR
jgi:transposase